ncbi:MAG TPA: methyl-accepting chemotaxis protein [Myxococcota bacterium]|nr:methyl-accepting chemotaxis protein [Myxococcota bacterium]
MSAQRRVVLLMACALVLVAAVVGGVQVARAVSDAREASREWVRAAAAQLAHLAAQPMASPASGAALVPVLSAAKALPGVVDAAFVDASGHIVISTRTSEVGLMAPAAWREAGEAAVFPRGSEEVGDSATLVVAPVRAGTAAIGSLALRIAEPSVATTARRALAVGAAAAGVAIATFLAILWRLFGALLSPVAESERVLTALASGDVSARLDAQKLGSFEGLGRGLNTLAEALGGVLSRVQHLTQRMQSAPERVAQVMDEIATGVEAQTEAVEETASLLANINTSIKGINAEVDSLSRSAEEASSSVLQMGSAIDEVARSAASLHDSVDSSTSSIHEMGASIRQVADSADAVQRMAEETASSMTQMDRTIQEVGEHVREASVLTQQVSQGAEVGSSAVSDTIEGIEEIRNLTRGAKDVLERLAARINEIGEIVNVIGSINDETNLLSLNAAIIAAQAGEQGKAFAVVANHVKTLAQRTAGSTQEIERLIRAVQAESDNAMRAMGAGIDSVEAGVARSSRAGEALQVIRTSARDASARVAEIARAAQEQAQSSRHVAEAAQRTSQMVQQISGAIGEQSRASEAMLKNSEGALEVCRQVHRSTSEQRETAKFITASIASVAEMIRSIQENTASHARASESVSSAVSRILETARKSSERIPEVLSTVEDLRTDADALAQEVGRFRS